MNWLTVRKRGFACESTEGIALRGLSAEDHEMRSLQHWSRRMTSRDGLPVSECGKVVSHLHHNIARHCAADRCLVVSEV
jgi:hypothetical protein